MSTSQSRQSTSAKAISFDETNMLVELQDGTTVSTPLSRFPRLLRATSEQRSQRRRIGAGDGIHWPLIDEDISISGLLNRERKMDADPRQIKEVMELLGKTYANSLRLSMITGGRRFTLDGVFVSTAGKVVAEYVYGLEAVAENEGYPARTSSGRSVQVMLAGATASGSSIRWKDKHASADLLLCLRFGPNGFDEVYNGPFPEELLAGKATNAKGYTYLPTSLLDEEHPALLPRQNSFASLNTFFQSKLNEAA